MFRRGIMRFWSKLAWEVVVKCFTVFALSILLASPALGQVYRYEAETGSLTGTSIFNSTPGFSGTGYVGGFDVDGDKVSIPVNSLPDGLYELWVRYNAPYGSKGYGVQVDSEIGENWFPATASNQFLLDRAGLFNLTGTTNTLQIQKNWGYYNVDYLELRPATVRAPLAVAPHLSDPAASFRTQALMNYLSGIYGVKTLSGQQGQVGVSGAFPSTSYLSESGNLVPAVRGSDFIEYSPSRLEHGSNPNGETERIVNWARATGGIPTMMWHWNAPTDLIDQPGKEWWRGFYTDATTFDVQAALANPSGQKYQLLIRDIDAIAIELKKFQTAGVPVIWRPLHEAQGNAPEGQAWFWWGAKGAQPFKDLWRLMYDRLTTYHGLHNLIWEFTSSADQSHLEWYPGDDVVDIVGLDVYTNAASSMSGQWLDTLDVYDGRKMIALSETGNLPIANLLRERGIEWSYFSPWSVSDIVNNYTPAQIQALLGDTDVITLNELPVMPWNILAPIAGDYNKDGVVNAADYVVWRNTNGQTGWGLAADSDLNGRIDAADYAFWRAHFGAPAGNGTEAGPATIPEPATLALFFMGILSMCTCRRAGVS
jgi:mannan endo-1,4-beta-mannosidase